jgi:hypothetical protein
MRRLIILTIAFMFICMPLLAQETGTEVSGSGADAGAGEAGGCGKIMLGGMSEPEGEDAAAGTDVAEEGAEAEGDLYYDEVELPPEGAASEEAVADCAAPDADGFFVCTEDGVSYNCYCCDDADQQIPYSDTCDPCCLPME